MRSFRAGLLLGTLALSAACTPRDETPPATAQFPACPNDRETTESTAIGPEGGALQLAGHRLELPPGAVAEPVQFSATLHADSLLKLTLRADQRESYAFAEPATLTLGLAACEAGVAEQRPRIYKIDPETHRVLREIGGEVDARAGTVAARLDSLSSYTIGVH